jgi:hypothetical protein
MWAPSAGQFLVIVPQRGHRQNDRLSINIAYQRTQRKGTYEGVPLRCDDSLIHSSPRCTAAVPNAGE